MGLTTRANGTDHAKTPKPVDCPKEISESPRADSGYADSTDLNTVNEKLAGLTTEEKTKPSRTEALANPFDDDDESDEDDGPIDLSDYTEEEIGCANKSVRILPGVRKLIDSLPKERYAVATSGAKTCARPLCRCSRTEANLARD